MQRSIFCVRDYLSIFYIGIFYGSVFLEDLSVGCFLAREGWNFLSLCESPNWCKIELPSLEIYFIMMRNRTMRNRTICRKIRKSTGKDI